MQSVCRLSLPCFDEALSSAAADGFDTFCQPCTHDPLLISCRYVKGAELMNVNSQVQIRQLLFPDLCAEPVKAFKAENPDYDPNARPRPRRWLDFELHGIWGMGQPGRLTADVKTDKGLAAVSGAVLWSLVGKPGAAAKALAELDAAEAAAAGDGGDNTQQQQQPQQVAASSIFDDDDDDELSTHDLHDDGDGNPTAAAAAGRGKDGARQEDEEEEVVRIVPGGDLSADQLAALQQEAASKKLGKMYVAMGGGREGLEACEALEKLIEVRRQQHVGGNEGGGVTGFKVCDRMSVYVWQCVTLGCDGVAQGSEQLLQVLVCNELVRQGMCQDAW